MQILHILNHVQEIGNGIVNVAVDLACLQSQNGHDVAIASAGGEYEVLLMHKGVKHFHLNQTRSPLNLLRAVQGYQEIITSFQPDIVHAHMMTGIVLARTLKASSKYTIVSTVHNEFQRSAILMGLADRVIAVSQAVADSMEKRGVPKSKLRVVSNGTLASPRRQSMAEYTPVHLQNPAIVTVAGMYSRKGISELIDAFALVNQVFPDVHLYIVGNGPEREKFIQQALQKGGYINNHIHFEGFQPEPQKYMLGADIFVLASHKDPSPLVIPEAREAGCAIIATNVDGIPEALDYGQAGILIEPKNPQVLAEALADLLSSTDKLQDWQGKAKKNLERLQVQRVSMETMRIYEELLADASDLSSELGVI